jgi:hypothetical protein
MLASLRIPPVVQAIAAACEGLVRMNQVLMRMSDVPPIRDAGVFFREERAGREDWDNCLIVLARGWGDCEDLASWYCAELRESGEDPGAEVVIQQTGPAKLHAVVRRASGDIDDICWELLPKRG